MITTLSLRGCIVHVIEDPLHESSVVGGEEGDEGILVGIRRRSADRRNDRVREDGAGLLEQGDQGLRFRGTAAQEFVWAVVTV